MEQWGRWEGPDGGETGAVRLVTRQLENDPLAAATSTTTATSAAATAAATAATATASAAAVAPPTVDVVVIGLRMMALAVAMLRCPCPCRCFCLWPCCGPWWSVKRVAQSANTMLGHADVVPALQHAQCTHAHTHAHE